MAALADALIPADRPGDFAQALMDFGSLICIPKQPNCSLCPIEQHCVGLSRGLIEQLPLKAPERERPTKRGAAYIVFDRKGFILLERRPARGLLGSMMQPPLGPWRKSFPTCGRALKESPVLGKWKKLPGLVRHSFTHFQLELEVYVARFTRRPKFDGVWVSPDKLSKVALPTVMKKLIHHALGIT
jgi:A/G-specific adenine glycosylase